MEWCGNTKRHRKVISHSLFKHWNRNGRNRLQTVLFCLHERQTSEIFLAMMTKVCEIFLSLVIIVEFVECNVATESRWVMCLSEGRAEKTIADVWWKTKVYASSLGIVSHLALGCLTDFTVFRCWFRVKRNSFRKRHVLATWFTMIHRMILFSHCSMWPQLNRGSLYEKVRHQTSQKSILSFIKQSSSGVSARRKARS